MATDTIKVSKLCDACDTELCGDDGSVYHEIDRPIANPARAKRAVDGGGIESNGSLFKSCKHTAANPVAVVGGISFYGAQKFEICEARMRPGVLIVNLTGVELAQRGVIKARPAALTGIEAFGTFRPDELLIDWPDMGVPKLPPAFWRFLAQRLKRLNYKEVVFCCIGGHGRTGTGLVCMLTAMGLPPKRAIELVRGYCSHTIETKAQENYIVDVAVWLDDNPAPRKRNRKAKRRTRR